MVIVPASGVSNPAMSRSSVVLPQPDDPTTAVVAARLQSEVDVVQHRVCRGTTWRVRVIVEDGGRHSAAAFVDCRNSTSVTGIASTTSTSA